MTFARRLDQAMWQGMDWHTRRESSGCQGHETGACEVIARKTEVGSQGDKWQEMRSERC